MTSGTVLTKITPGYVLDNHVVVPYDGVDTLNKARNPHPEHVQASASVPSYEKKKNKAQCSDTGIVPRTLQMPIERDSA